MASTVLPAKAGAAASVARAAMMAAEAFTDVNFMFGYSS
jgi:hypothetical protein